jgi:hypothetical protein
MPPVFSSPTRRHRDRPLIELAPSWIQVGDRIVGVAFRCPIHDIVPCTDDIPCTHRVGFKNPPDGGPAPERWRVTWERRAGETFETLFLWPSIRNLGFEDGGGCHWHGFVGLERPGIVMTLDDSK